MSKQKFKLPITFEAYCEVEVEAQTLDEAVNKINKQIDLDELPLPTNYEISHIELTSNGNSEEDWKWYKTLNNN